jgi:energy-coupling factor transporter ATP-binding protein EcfA2
MKLSKIRIQNFRSFRDETIYLSDYNCFVGPNGSGKSCVLAALNIFFRNSSAPLNPGRLDEEDFHFRNTDDPVLIELTFTGLSDDAREDFQHYVRQNQLVVSAKAIWDEDAHAADVQQYGSRYVMKEFSPYFEADAAGARAKELKQIYAGLRSRFPELPDEKVKANMYAALREYEEAHPDACVLEPSSQQFYGWSNGANKLARYVQWVYVPAVKDASEEQQEGKNTALGQLLERRIRSNVDFSDSLREIQAEAERRYREMIKESNDALTDVAGSIRSRLQDWSHPGVRVDMQWHYDPKKSVSVNEPLARVLLGDGPFTGELIRMGHGLQRSFIVALLQELAEADTSSQPTLLLGFEEPELYQHPPQARHLAHVLESLTRDDGDDRERGAQVFITTHSPYFVSGRGFESVRMTRKVASRGSTKVSAFTHQELTTKLADALGEPPVAPTATMAKVEQVMQPSQNELFFARVPVLVEGLEDIAYIATHLKLAKRWPEFRRTGCHFVVCEGKGQMSRPLAIAVGLNIPAFVVFDSDGDETNENERAKHERDNVCLLRLLGVDNPDPFPDAPAIGERWVIWDRDIRAAVRDDIGTDRWHAAEQAARDTYGVTGKSARKNKLVIAAALETVWDAGHRSAHLDELADALLSFAGSLSEVKASPVDETQASLAPAGGG